MQRKLSVPNEHNALVRRAVAEEFGKFVEIEGCMRDEIVISTKDFHGWSEEQSEHILARAEMLITGLLYPRD